MATVVSNLLKKNVVQQEVASGGLLNAAKVGLFSNSPALTGTSVPANFTEPLFTGYAKQNAPFGTVTQLGDGSYEVVGAMLKYQATTGTPSDTVQGYFVTDTGGTNLCFAEYFAAPIPVTTLDSAVYVAVKFNYADVSCGTAVTTS